MNHMTSLRIETMRIADSPRFARSCKLRSLLLYLLSRADRPARVTQFDLATQGLGRHGGFDETTDTSVRTSMTRLRRLLAEHYAVEQPHDGMCVYIRPGEYRLRTASLQTAYPELARRIAGGAPEPAPLEDRDPEPATSSSGADEQRVPGTPADAMPPRNTSSRWRSPGSVWVAIVLPILLAAASAVLYRHYAHEHSAATSPGRQVHVPVVAFQANITEDENAAAFRQVLDAEATKALHRSMISRAATGRETRPDYTMHFTANLVGKAQDTALLSLVDRHGSVLTETSIRLMGDFTQDGRTIRRSLQNYLSPIGPIAKDVLSGTGAAPASGFECFLRVENLRAEGADTPALLTDCIARFPDSRYYPFLATREIFYRIQKLMVSGGSVTDRSPEWRDLSSLLNAHPGNPYALALAAKMLVGQGRCDEAMDFAERSYMRGRTYAAMELTLIVDALGCDDLPEALRDYLVERVDAIASAEDHPEPLIEAYLVLGRLALGQREEAERILAKPFQTAADRGSAAAREALQRVVSGQVESGDRDAFARRLRSLIYNGETRRRILRSLPA